MSARARTHTHTRTHTFHEEMQHSLTHITILAGNDDHAVSVPCLFNGTAHGIMIGATDGFSLL